VGAGSESGGARGPGATLRAASAPRGDGGAARGRALPLLWRAVVLAGLVALLAIAPAAAAEPSGVVLNEVNCTGTDWVEVLNRSDVAVSLANWLLTDDAVDRVPPRDSHRMRFGADAVLAPGARLVVTKDVDFPFGLSCGDDTLRLADATDTLVDSTTLPVLASGDMTLGRIPDGSGGWTVTLPTPGAANAVAPDAQGDDPAWLYDPLQVTEVDLEAEPAVLARLDSVPDEYVEARITMRNGTSTYGPYVVGLRLKGHASFRPLTGKAAFKVKFGYSVSGQRFHGLKGLTLNNMVQDPSMISEATTSLLMTATGVPTARVGFAYVRLNGADYGLYANVESVDAVMSQRWFTGTQHVYEADLGGEDAIPGRAGDFQVDEGSSTDLSDLEALATANAGGTDGWWDRMQAVADLGAMTRAFAAEHYVGHWDGYSIRAEPVYPNNYYLHSDPAGRFALIPSGTDQTWHELWPFGAYGKGVLMRGCVADATCRQLYVDALRQIAAAPAVAALPAQARAIRAVIAPWRARDPRREQTVAAGEAQADAEIAAIDARPNALAEWLASPSFVDTGQPAPSASWGGGGVGSTDLSVTGSVAPDSSPVGGSHVWRLQVKNTGWATALGVVLDVRLSPNIAYGFSQATRGTGCVPAGAGLRCSLDFLGPSAYDGSTAEVVIGTNVTGAGEVSLTATASSTEEDPTPADNTLVLTANAQPAVTPVVTAAVRPVLGKPVVQPSKPVAGKRLTFTLPVTRSDTGKPLLTGTMSCAPSVAGKAIKHTESFRSGKARLSFVVPTTAKHKLLKVTITITAAGRAARHTYTYAIR
jgi:hypothetical protein